MTFLRVSEVLKSSILRSGDPSSLAALQVFKAFQQTMVELYGKKHSKKELLKIKPKKFSWGTLIAWTPSSVWSQELKLRSADILNKVNKRLKEKVVRELELKVRK